MRWEAHRPRRASPPTAALGSATRVAPPGLGTARATRWRCRGRAPAAACPATRTKPPDVTALHRRGSPARLHPRSGPVDPLQPTSATLQGCPRARALAALPRAVLPAGLSRLGSPRVQAYGEPTSGAMTPAPSPLPSRCRLGASLPSGATPGVVSARAARALSAMRIPCPA